MTPHEPHWWPYRDFDAQAIRAAGTRPVPLNEFVVKVHSRCDLACDYCYVYAAGDSTWQRMPPVMSAPVADLAVARIAEHVHRHGVRRPTVILHGGEPLLAGPDLIRRIATGLRAAIPAGCDVSVQTNGVRLDRSWLELFAELGIQVGVSLDGDQPTHDRHRVDHRGRGSYTRVRRAVDLLRGPEFRQLYAGVLCVVDVSTDPLAVYRALRELDPPAIGLLLPHGTWSAPPPGRPPDDTTPYADWLIPVFDEWFDTTRPPWINLFDSLLALCLGGASSSELVGLSPSRGVVIDTDGSLEQVDTLRSAYPGASATPLHVGRDALDAVLEEPGVVARQLGRAALSAQCLACPVVDVCGGGYYPHRFHPAHGFRHRSVYCPDLLALVTHVRWRVREQLPSLLPAGSGGRA